MESVGTEAAVSHIRIATARAWFSIEQGGRIRKQRDSQALLHLPSLSWIMFHPRLKCVSLPVNHWFAIWDRKTELGEKQ